LYSPNGGKLALMNGQTVSKAFIPLPAGAAAVYTSGPTLSYYRHPDWLGSIRFGSTPSRTMYFDVSYAPYGETYAESGTPDRVFAGMDQDTVQGSTAALYDATFREYAQYGRWISPDPAGRKAVNIANPQTWNRYAYVTNNPLALIDPNGLGGGAPWPCPPGVKDFQTCGFSQINGILSGGFGGYGCTVDGVPTGCDYASDVVRTNVGVPCPGQCSGFVDGQYVVYVASAAAQGYVKFSDLAQGLYDANGKFYTPSQWQTYLAQNYSVSGQFGRLTSNMASLGMPGKVDQDKYSIDGGHADFAFSCPDAQDCGPGMYPLGIHVKEDSSGQLWIHDDTVTPWISPFSFSTVNPINFLKHGIIDVLGGNSIIYVFPY
jgi:RHS repeat-associated protein